MIGVILGTLIGDLYGISWWWSGVLSGIVIAIIFRKNTLTLFLIGVILAHGFHGTVIEKQKAWAESLDSKLETRHICLNGIITNTGTNTRGPYLLKVTDNIDNLELPSGIYIQLFISNLPEETKLLKYGDTIQVEGNLIAVPELRNPHGFDQRTWLHRQGANLIMHPTKEIVISGVAPFRIPVRTMNQWHVYLRKQMTVGLDENSQEAQLIRAVVLGEKPPQPSDMLENFRHSGTLHVFAVSGLHVGMVGTIVGLALWLFRVPRWILIPLTILSMASYAGITGLRPPSVRAVLMATIFLSGFLIQRRPTLINSLAASAVLVLLWDGHQLFTPSSMDGLNTSYVDPLWHHHPHSYHCRHPINGYGFSHISSNNVKSSGRRCVATRRHNAEPNKWFYRKRHVSHRQNFCPSTW